MSDEVVDDFDSPAPLDDSEDSDDPFELAESPFVEALSEEPFPDDAVAFAPRLSVLKKPLPLNVTPTGWNTFFTGKTSPDVGCSYSVRLSSVNDWRTSTVSPVSTNLYTYVGINCKKISSARCRSAVQ